MFNRVFKTFFSYFVVYMGLIISFAFGFFFLITPPAEDKTAVDNKTAGEEKTAAEIVVEMLKENEKSNYPRSLWKLLPKVFVMFSGEQDFMNIPFDQNQTEENPTLVTLYSLFQCFFYLAFLLVMVVILFNLLNGLAVRDAGEMLDSAEVDMLYSLLSIVAFWDKFVSKGKLVSNEERKQPDDEESQCPRNEDCKQLWVRLFRYVVGKEPANEDCEQSGPKINFRLRLPNCFPQPIFPILNQGGKLYFKIYEKKCKSYNAYGYDEKSKTDKVLDFSIKQEIAKMSNEIVQIKKIRDRETGALCDNDDDRWGLTLLKKYLVKREELENKLEDTSQINALINSTTNYFVRPEHLPTERTAARESKPHQQYSTACPLELYARAIYDYTPLDTEYSQQTELGFKEGDVIRLLFEYIGGGWMMGELRGKLGVFPYQYVEIINDKAKKSIAEVAKDEGGTTLATKQGIFISARSSSVMAGWGPQFSIGIDGLISNHFPTKLEDYPWLEIQLGVPTLISGVIIFNRADCFGERFKNAEIRAGMDRVPGGTIAQMLDINTVCGTYEGPGITGSKINIDCIEPIWAKYITIQLGDKNSILNINDLKVRKENAEVILL